MEVLKATRRSEIGSHKIRRIRGRGLVPAIIYGHGEENLPVALDGHDVVVALLHGERVLEIDVDGQKQNVLIKDVQYDPLGKSVLHMDLARVSLDERVEVTVPIVLRGAPTAEGGVLQQMAAEASIECAVHAIPDDIRVSVAGLALGGVVRMKDLPLPEGARMLEEPEAIVATYAEVAEEEEVPTEEAPAEPEVIGEKKEPEEGEQEEK